MLTTKQAAALLGVTPARVRQLVKEKKFKATPYGTRFMLIDERDLTEYIRSAPPIKGRKRAYTKPKKDTETRA